MDTSLIVGTQIFLGLVMYLCLKRAVVVYKFGNLVKIERKHWIYRIIFGIIFMYLFYHIFIFGILYPELYIIDIGNHDYIYFTIFIALFPGFMIFFILLAFINNLLTKILALCGIEYGFCGCGNHLTVSDALNNEYSCLDCRYETDIYK